MEREDDLLCIYYSMSCLKYYFFFRATVMEESSIARRVVRALDLQHNTPFPVFFSFPAASRLSRVE